jgi:hypothetical protein
VLQSLEEISFLDFDCYGLALFLVQDLEMSQCGMNTRSTAKFP